MKAVDKRLVGPGVIAGKEPVHVTKRIQEGKAVHSLGKLIACWY
jgi:hypothetical protein